MTNHANSVGNIKNVNFYNLYKTQAPTLHTHTTLALAKESHALFTRTVPNICCNRLRATKTINKKLELRLRLCLVRYSTRYKPNEVCACVCCWYCRTRTDRDGRCGDDACAILQVCKWRIFFTKYFVNEQRFTKPFVQCTNEEIVLAHIRTFVQGGTTSHTHHICTHTFLKMSLALTEHKQQKPELRLRLCDMCMQIIHPHAITEWCVCMLLVFSNDSRQRRPLQRRRVCVCAHIRTFVQGGTNYTLMLTTLALIAHLLHTHSLAFFSRTFHPQISLDATEHEQRK